MSRIRVIHVAEAAGGVERYLQGLLKYSDHQSIEDILICSQNYDTSKFKDIASKIYQVSMAHGISFSADRSAIKQIRKLVKKMEPDVVYAHSSKAGALTRLACLGLKIPVIYNPHGWAFNMRQSKLKTCAYRLIEKIQAPFTTKIVCISKSEQKSALDNKICKSDKLEVIPNGIDFAEIDKAKKITRKELGIPEDAFVVGQVGRLTRQKAPDIFVEMASRVKQEVPNAYFLMVGNGDQEAEIRQKIKSLGLEDSFLITGWVENPTSYINCMDVATLLSRWEGFGLVLAEYMYCRVPIVATKVDAIPYVVEDDVNGLLVDVDDSSIAAEAVIKIRNSSDLRNSLVNSGLKSVRNKYDVTRVAEQTDCLFQLVITK
jgi:glycosyltransferase involved in cell wall biosynthesis